MTIDLDLCISTKKKKEEKKRKKQLVHNSWCQRKLASGMHFYCCHFDRSTLLLLVWRSTGVYACLLQFMDFALNALSFYCISVYHTDLDSEIYQDFTCMFMCLAQAIPIHTQTKKHRWCISKRIQPKTSVNSCCILLRVRII